MDEQSHKEEMRAALRGDFERLHARRNMPATPGVEGPASPAALQTAPPAVARVGQDAPHEPGGTDRQRGWPARLLGRES